MIRWAAIWIIGTVALTGLLQWIIDDWNLNLWKNSIEWVASLFFLIALIVGGVLTTERAYYTRKKPFYREEWSIICIIVTIMLFGISYILK